MMSLDVLERNGFAFIPTSVADSLAGHLGRLGESRQLVAADADRAEPWSLTGRFGKAAFPWHTDGAVSSSPPRWLMLRPVQLDAPTSTELLRPDVDLLDRLASTLLVVADRLGRRRYVPALTRGRDDYRLRWDSRICRPLTDEAEIDSLEPTVAIEWRPGWTLIVDNFRLLHRRPAVSGSSTRVLERTYIWSD